MIAEVVCADVMEWAADYDGLPFHCILCDPPYELNFMSRSWDSTGIAFRPETWAALAEHLLPGAFVFAFASTRGWHRMACAMEDAGLIMQPSIFVNGAVLEVPMMLGWLTGQSFPKASRIDTQVDRAAGVEQQHTPNPLAKKQTARRGTNCYGDYGANSELSLPATALSRAWEGHRYGGQILKNCLEPIIVCQKPWGKRRLDDIVETGAGALNVDAGRVRTTEIIGWGGNPSDGYSGGLDGVELDGRPVQGRWPPNLALVHSPGCVRTGTQRVKGEKLRRLHHQSDSGFVDTGEGYYTTTHGDADGLETIDDWLCEEGCPVAELDAQVGILKSGTLLPTHKRTTGKTRVVYGERAAPPGYSPGSEGGPSHFYPQADWSHEIAERLATCAPVYYCPKSSRRERDAGLGAMPPKIVQTGCGGDFPTDDQGRKRDRFKATVHNNHPCVKSISLCIWLAKLLLPPSEYAPRRILVPFAGSGSEMVACVLAGFEEIIGIEMSEEYCTLARARLRFWHTWHEHGYTDPAEVLRRTKKRKQIDERQLKFKL